MAGLTASVGSSRIPVPLSVVLTLVALTAVSARISRCRMQGGAGRARSGTRADPTGPAPLRPCRRRPRRRPARSLPSPPVPPPAERAQSTSPDVPVVNVKPVYVMAQQESYHASHATTATKTDTPIMETPFSIQVVPQQVLKDQQTTRASTMR